MLRQRATDARITGALCVHVLFAVLQMYEVTSPDEAEYFRYTYIYTYIHTYMTA